VASPHPLVLFDFNGVIADDEPVHQRLLQRVLAGEGITVTDAEYHDTYLGYDDRGCFLEAHRRAGRALDAAGVAALIAKKSALYDAYIADHLVLFPGAVESVKALGERYPLGIVSGALRGEIDRICAVAGIVVGSLVIGGGGGKGGMEETAGSTEAVVPMEKPVKLKMASAFFLESRSPISSAEASGRPKRRRRAVAMKRRPDSTSSCALGRASSAPEGV